jgi:hypothetical protein
MVGASDPHTRAATLPQRPESPATHHHLALSLMAAVMVVAVVMLVVPARGRPLAALLTTL